MRIKKISLVLIILAFCLLAENTKADEVLAVGSWFQTQNGDVGSVSNLPCTGGSSLCQPANPGPNSSYAVFVNGTAANFNSVKSWLVQTYNTNYQFTQYDYNTFWAKYQNSASVFCLSPLSNCALPSGISLYRGSTDTSTYVVSTTNSNTNYAGTTPAVVFIPGSLQINSNFTATSNVLFIVQGNVTVDPTVTALQAGFIVQGSFNTLSAALVGDSCPGCGLAPVGAAMDNSNDTYPLDRMIGLYTSGPAPMTPFYSYTYCQNISCSLNTTKLIDQATSPPTGTPNTYYYPGPAIKINKSNNIPSFVYLWCNCANSTYPNVPAGSYQMDLRYATCSDYFCNTVSTQTVVSAMMTYGDGTFSWSDQPSIGLTTTGVPVLSFGYKGNLYTAAPVSGSSGIITTGTNCPLVSGTNPNWYCNKIAPLIRSPYITSLAVGTDNLTRIFFSPGGNGFEFVSRTSPGLGNCASDNNWKCEFVSTTNNTANWGWTQLASGLGTCHCFMYKLDLDSLNKARIAYTPTGGDYISAPSSPLYYVQQVTSGGTGCTTATNPANWTCVKLNSGGMNNSAYPRIKVGAGDLAYVYAGQNTAANNRYYIQCTTSPCTNSANWNLSTICSSSCSQLQPLDLTVGKDTYSGGTPNFGRGINSYFHDYCDMHSPDTDGVNCDDGWTSATPEWTRYYGWGVNGFSTTLFDSPITISGFLAAYGGINLQRQVQDNTTPSEIFNYDSSVLYYFAQMLGSERTVFSELSP